MRAMRCLIGSGHGPGNLFAGLRQNTIEHGSKFKFTGRMAGYAAVVTILAAVLAFLVFTRSDVEATFLRAPGAMFQELPGGKIENLYTVQLVNKTSRDMVAEIKLLSGTGELQVMGASPVPVPKESLAETSVLIQLPARTGRRKKNLRRSAYLPKANCCKP